MSNMQTAILFPGQGAQATGMGRRLAEASSDIMELWKKAEAVSGLPLREIYWESDDASLMAETRTLQPALTVVNFALFLSCADRFTPVAAAGHSLGEFAALAAAKVLPFDKVLELVTLRGQLMADADPDHEGSMMAVLRLPLDLLEEAAKQAAEATGKVVRVANRNTPAQYVISGHKQALEMVYEGLKENSVRGKFFPLAVSGAFHTPMMSEANAEFVKLLDRQDWQAAIFPIYSNVSGEPLVEANLIRNAMRKQMTSAVQWVDTVGNMWKNGVRRWIEFGPQGVTSRMVRPILSAIDVDDNDYSTLHIANFDSVKAFEG
ncbi:MAG: ACP S-malonyltransferase [Mailhella sp.]|nr:ACP S-malonyltransferase [Mailhella sp.]